MASLMLDAILLSDKLIRPALQELLSGTVGKCAEGRAGAQLPPTHAEQIMQERGTLGKVRHAHV